MNKTSETPGGGGIENPAGKDTAASTATSENGAGARTSRDEQEVWKGRYEELRRVYELGAPRINEELEVLKKRTIEIESALKTGARDAARGAESPVQGDAAHRVNVGAAHRVNTGPVARHAQTGAAGALENLVSPAHSSTPAATGAVDTEVFSEEQIRTFYNALSRGKFKGTAQEAGEIEKRIGRAVKEGRVTGR
jgi:hypothetical protein